MFVVTNTIKVKEGAGQELAKRFAEGQGVQEMPGFVRLEVWHGVNKDQEELKVCTMWENEQSFRNWTSSDAFRAAHQGRGKNEAILGASLDTYELMVQVSAEE
ncbi:antibiotic biosynthesis monooxygenase [Paenibacillus jiagnxiensis]|uniref:antibiotic biosynthesis monooxygenase n=1 Tax=Paenibacillus jiagnxiensis TaxID=3228926 RepID=UPI0033B57E25